MQSMHVYTDLARLYTGRPRTNKIDCFLHNGVGFFPQSMIICLQLFSHLFCSDHSFTQKNIVETGCTFWWYLPFIWTHWHVHDVRLQPCVEFPFLLVFPLTQDWKDDVPQRESQDDKIHLAHRTWRWSSPSKHFRFPLLKAIWTLSGFRLTYAQKCDRFNIFLYLAWKITTLNIQATQCQGNKLET